SFRHVCACACCVVALLSAFVISAVTPALANAFVSSGLSNCCQRTDDCVSGSRTQTCTLAFFDFGLATAPAATAIWATAAPSTRINPFFPKLLTLCPPSCTFESALRRLLDVPFHCRDMGLRRPLRPRLRSIGAPILLSRAKGAKMVTGRDRGPSFTRF